MSESSTPSPRNAGPAVQGRRRWIAWVLLALFAVAWFGGLGYRDLNQPDEGRYAEIPREMLATGNWVTPRLDGLKYFEKPPLQYWATAVSYELFGQSNASARLWTALMGFLTVPWVFFLGLRLYDRRTGVYAAAIAASSLIWVAMGHINTLDMGVSALLGFGIGALALAQKERGRRPRWVMGWMLFGWAMLAAATLSKGLIGLVLPGGAVVFYSLWQRDWTLWRNLHLVKGLILLVALTAPWFVLVSRENPTFLWFFFIHEHFLRYLTPEAHRSEPWWFFLAIMWLGMLPWVGAGVRAVVRLGRSWRLGDGSFNAERFFWTYGAFMLAFFSASDSKLVPYILPMYPMLAVLSARQLVRHPRLRIDASAAAGLAVALLVVAAVVGRFATPTLPAHLLVAGRPWLVATALVLLAGAAAVFWFKGRGRRAVLCLAAASLVGFQLLNMGYQVLSPMYSSRVVARAMAPIAKTGVPLYSVGEYEQALPFYLKRTMTLVHWQGELRYGIQRQPDKWIPTVSAFVKLWDSESQALAVMKPGLYERLKAAGLPMRVIYQDSRRVAVARR